MVAVFAVEAAGADILCSGFDPDTLCSRGTGYRLEPDKESASYSLPLARPAHGEQQGERLAIPS